MSVRKRLATLAARMVLLAAATHVGLMNLPSARAQPPQGKSESAPKLELEVASVRPSGPLEAGATETMRMTGGPGTDDPERITYSRVPMRYLISTAYGVGLDQISGPEWVVTGQSPYGRYGDPRGAAPYDLSAKVPPGTTKEQLAQILQNVLAERFHLAFHHGTKEFSGYALVIGKEGSRLKASAGPISEAERALESPARTTPGGNTEVSRQLQRDGFPQLFPGRNMGGRYQEDEVRIRFRDYPLFDLAQQLSFALAARIVDKTGMTNKYDFTLKLELPQDAFMVGFGVISPLATPGQAWRGTTSPPATAQVDAVPIISAAMEKQLGLKLEATKIPMDVLVIDNIERVPTED